MFHDAGMKRAIVKLKGCASSWRGVTPPHTLARQMSAVSNSPMTVDMRSDTVTRPTEGMLAAMVAAPVGDDVMGEDATVNKLEASLAERFGKEAGLFLPTGTMSNLSALLSHCDSRGSELISGSRSHITLYEAGGCASLGGIHNRQVVEEADGTMDLNEIAAAFRSDDQHFPVTKVVCLENSHNVCGGAPLPPTYVNAVGSLCRQNGIALHIDGARIFNAAVSSRCRFDGVK